ncbi:hypothetical protein QMK19_32175 [Streptomyces sp. H10-C2]|uniref:hypothetical protein n=1 Tax=unclassified Streptomyces TaxID=2593676 RepID=UPI0024BA651E|nr:MULTISPECIES: hypothetical protein [unclassified Streptomyces]MDJ0346403.1 hypothetical protein [Streptomyces sp. PH10-H1]MDJ0374166.1 hypothetical protein [Streptomyces sp. H10-C2]
MDAVRVALLRDVLAGTEWILATRSFAGSLRASVRQGPGGLLLVGTREYEPWHLAAHLDDEATWSGLPELSPTLMRFRVPAGAPAHLGVGLRRLEVARRGETVFVVTPDRPGAALLERVADARRAGATVLAMDGGDPALRELAHDALTVPAEPDPETDPVPVQDPEPDPTAGAAVQARMGMDLLQHLVAAAAGENSLTAARRRGPFRDRLSRLAEQLTSPPPARW